MAENVSVDRDELLHRYETTGDEDAFLEARRRFEQALSDSPVDAEANMNYGYLLECHARNEMRRAAAFYERAIELDPDAEKPRYHVIGVRAGLLETEIPISIYERRLAASPDDVSSHRLLAAAYLAGHRYQDAQRVIETGLALAPSDATLVESRGDVRAGTGDVEGALADWRRSHELNPENLSSLFSSAFLLERVGRLDEAMDDWHYIIAWSEDRGSLLESEWPKRELARLRVLSDQGTTGEARG